MKALILSGYGINCEDETVNAFKTVGIKGIIVHVNDLIENPKKIKEENFNITGAAVNAPLVKKIISRMIEILKIPKFNISEILNAAIRINYQRYYVT